MTAHSGLPKLDHKEAVRLAWKSRHFPFYTLLLATLLMSGVLSMVSMVSSYSR